MKEDSKKQRRPKRPWPVPGHRAKPALWTLPFWNLPSHPLYRLALQAGSGTPPSAVPPWKAEMHGGERAAA